MPPPPRAARARAKGGAGAPDTTKQVDRRASTRRAAARGGAQPCLPPACLQQDRHTQLAAHLLRAEAAPDPLERLLAVTRWLERGGARSPAAAQRSALARRPLSSTQPPFSPTPTHRAVLCLLTDLMRPGAGYAQTPTALLGQHYLSRRQLGERVARCLCGGGGCGRGGKPPPTRAAASASSEGWAGQGSCSNRLPPGHRDGTAGRAQGPPRAGPTPSLTRPPPPPSPHLPKPSATGGTAWWCCCRSCAPTSPWRPRGMPSTRGRACPPPSPPWRSS